MNWMFWKKPFKVGVRSVIAPKAMEHDDLVEATLKIQWNAIKRYIADNNIDTNQGLFIDLIAQKPFNAKCRICDKIKINGN